MLRGLLLCCLFLLSNVLLAQSPKAVLVNGVPVMNLPSASAITVESTTTTRTSSPFGGQQSQNLCGVTASFTPGVDSFFSESKSITFTSTSINAATLQWGINGLFFYGYTNTFSYSFQPGVYLVSLVAANGNCRDTATVTIVCSGSAPAEDHGFYGSLGLVNSSEKATAICPAKDGGYLVGGNTDYKTPNYSNGILVKLKKKTCIEWSTMLQNVMITDACALHDSGFLVCGYSINNLNLLVRVSKTGSVVWSKTYDFGKAAQFIMTGIRHVYEMSDGSLVATTSPFDIGFSVVKLDAQGNVLWDRFLQKEQYSFDYTTTAAILEWKNSLYVVGNLRQPDTVFNELGPYTSFITKLDPQGGTATWSKMYFLPQYRMSNFFKEIQPYDTGFLLTALNYTTLGGIGVYPGLQWIDTNENPTKCISFTETQYPPNFPTMISGGALPGGNIFFKFAARELTGLQPGYFDHHYYLKVHDSTVLMEQLWNGGDVGRFDGESIVSVGTGYSALLPWMVISENMFFVRRDSTGITDGCSYNTSIFEGHGFNLRALPVNWVKDTVLNVKASDYPVSTADLYPQVRSMCPDYLDSCAVLNVSGEKSVCSLSDTYTYRAGRNSKCGQPVEWAHEGPLTVVKETDSSLTVRFSSFGKYKISARLRNSCNPMMDSMFVVAASKTAQLELGRDTTICPGNPLKLHASPYFLAYEWKDGSTDSVLTVSSAGRYWVRVIDSCGNSMYDTVQVSLAPPVPIDIGPDRTKCNNDTLHLNAPAGFLSYSWSNNYNINSLVSQTVAVNPLVDTAYYIKAEKTPGCFGFDTVRVRVSISPAISLGADKSFCSGDSAVFDAGAGFVQYAWSNGMSGQAIVAKKAGSYSVIGITTEGCKSYDTVRVVNVFAKPVVSLDHSSSLCTGSSRTLDAGSFASYLWNDGSTQERMTVNTTGTYSVEVTDYNGCRGNDTTRITTLLPLPAGFLPADTLICSYDKLTLTTRKSYSSYTWSTGSVLPSLIVSQPGTYWLQVKDNSGCVGRDTIIINPKDCMKGIYMPTAFSPNGDGRNDLFHPMLFGNVKKYSFTVYNRWGAVVFQTTELNRSWDGKVGGLLQEPNVFTWICTYQFEGEQARSEKGTVMLVR
jgi:gliding motility-associated-like protein